jgi:glycoside/pentoside/hexuronide:cation symporter, GPH family
VTDQGVQQPHVSPGATPLPARQRLLFGFGQLGPEALTRSKDAWLLFLYAPPAGSDLPQLLPLGLIGLLTALMRVIGALDDPVIGWWSDRTTSRWGRRVPFVVLGAPVWVLAAALLMNPPAEGSVARIAVWFVLTSQIGNIFSTMAGAPYDALIPEIARRGQDRVALATTRVYFSVGGSAAGLVASGLLVSRFGIGGMSIVMALLAIVSRYVGLFGVWSRIDRDQPPVQVSFLDGMRTTFRNRQFVAFLPAAVCFGSGITLVVGLLPFYATAVLQAGPGETGKWVSIMSAAAVLGVAAGAAMYARLARRLQKRLAYRRAMLLAAAVLPSLALVGLVPGLPVAPQAMLALFIGSVALAGAFVFPPALLSDIVDEEAARTGDRREGAYFGAQGFVDKTTGAFAPLLLSWLMLLGNTAANPLGVRLVGPVAAIIVLFGWWWFRKYTLDDIPEVAA